MGICDNRTILITGAGGGLGRSYALAFAAEGANVVVNDIRVEAAQAVADEVIAAGGHAIADSGDITSMAGAQTIIDAAVAAVLSFDRATVGRIEDEPLVPQFFV